MLHKILLDLVERVLAADHRLDAVLLGISFDWEERCYEMVGCRGVRAHYGSETVVFHKVSCVRLAIVAPQKVVPQ